MPVDLAAVQCADSAKTRQQPLQLTNREAKPGWLRAVSGGFWMAGCSAPALKSVKVKRSGSSSARDGPMHRAKENT